jgi:hypothetical protein
MPNLKTEARDTSSASLKQLVKGDVSLGYTPRRLTFEINIAVRGISRILAGPEPATNLCRDVLRIAHVRYYNSLSLDGLFMAHASNNTKRCRGYVKEKDESRRIQKTATDQRSRFAR